MVIYDTANIPFYNNQIFNKDIADKYPGATSIYLLSELCKKNDVKIYTADYVLNNRIEVKGAKIITEIISPWTKKLVELGAIRHAIICLETPSFAWKFYGKINSITKLYSHSFLFSGLEYKVSNLTVFHNALFPQPDLILMNNFKNKWNDRSFLVLINSNQIRRIYKPLHILYSLFDKTLSQEYYTLRLKAIMHFSKFSDFDLYGRNWHKKYWGIPNQIYKIALTKYRGTTSNKVQCLSNYKFSICFENASYQGYITEKIFDCFFAGCIPIYFGAPDIDEYIPKECFIDFAKFNNNFDKLEEFLLNFSEKDSDIMKNNIYNFLNSDKFYRFSNTYYANEIFKTLN